MKTAGNNNNAKRRTITMNEKGEPGTGSMLELLSNQPMGGINDHNNINFGFHEGELQYILLFLTVLNFHLRSVFSKWLVNGGVVKWLRRSVFSLIASTTWVRIPLLAPQTIGKQRN